jgi:glucosamine-6-phosphate deaminase
LGKERSQSAAGIGYANAKPAAGRPFERREMLVILKKNYEEISSEAARMVAAVVRNNRAATLGLATGATILGVYKELVRLHKEEALDFSRAVTFNLDEYLGLAADHPESFHYFMRENFFAHVNIRPENTHIPDGRVGGDYEKYCAAYEASIRKAGRIDLQILGIGRNGHIGFNEPTSSLASRTRLKVLNKETLEDNRKSFRPGEEIPCCAITMGIGTILEAKKIILLATGAAKADAVAKAIEGPVTSSLTASALQLHPDVTFILDEDAASELTQREYYRQVLEMTKIYTPSRLE